MNLEDKIMLFFASPLIAMVGYMVLVFWAIVATKLWRILVGLFSAA